MPHGGNHDPTQNLGFFVCLINSLIYFWQEGDLQSLEKFLHKPHYLKCQKIRYLWVHKIYVSKSDTGGWASYLCDLWYMCVTYAHMWAKVDTQSGRMQENTRCSVLSPNSREKWHLLKPEGRLASAGSRVLLSGPAPTLGLQMHAWLCSASYTGARELNSGHRASGASA